MEWSKTHSPELASPKRSHSQSPAYQPAINNAIKTDMMLQTMTSEVRGQTTIEKNGLFCTTD
jgi:hypothetical protein